MIKSALVSTKSPAENAVSAIGSNLWLWLLTFVAVIAYNLPWLSSHGASLTYGAYDLAEWASLNPEVRGSTFMLTSLLLRLPPLFIALIIAFHARKFVSISALFILITAVTLLPPLEFFTQFRSDPNYRQQFFIATMTLVGGVIGLSGGLWRWRWIATSLYAFLGLGVSIVGLMQAHNLMRDFALPVRIGIGIIGIVMAFMGILLIALLRKIKTGQR